MVEGTGLENQRWQHPQVRILSFPPDNKKRTKRRSLFSNFERNKNLELALVFLLNEKCVKA